MENCTVRHLMPAVAGNPGLQRRIGPEPSEEEATEEVMNFEGPFLVDLVGFLAERHIAGEGSVREWTIFHF